MNTETGSPARLCIIVEKLTVKLDAQQLSRYWLVANAGFKNSQLFPHRTQSAWQWAKNCVSVGWFTDWNVKVSSYGYQKSGSKTLSF